MRDCPCCAIYGLSNDMPCASASRIAELEAARTWLLDEIAGVVAGKVSTDSLRSVLRVAGRAVPSSGGESK